MVSDKTAKHLSGFPRRDENGAKIVDVGEGRAGDEEIAERAEEAIAFVVGKQLFGTEAAFRRPRKRVRSDDGSRIVLGTVDAVGIGSERINTSLSVERYGEGEEEFGVASTPPLAAHRHRRLAAGENGARRRDRLRMICAVSGDGGMDHRDVARLALDAVAEDERGEPGRVRD